MSRIETQFDIYQNQSKNFAVKRAEGFVSLIVARAKLLEMKAELPGNYWIRRITTTDYSDEDLGL